MNQKPDQPVSINVFEQINSICADFRKHCRQGDNPQIEDFLTDLESDARTTLFRNLLHIDIEYRRRIKQQPSSADYVKRFPEFARMIRQAFFEDTMMSMQVMHSTSVDGHTAPFDSLAPQAIDDGLFEVPAANRLGDYLLIKELGRGGFGVVYEAQHAQRQNRVALKTLPTGGQRGHVLDDAERLHKFRREFRSLADMNHPNLIGMQTLEVDGHQWFFTMDLIDGVDFLSYVRPEGSFDESRLRHVLPQLVNGIMSLHGQHIIHRDLKPSNVMVDGDGKVTILDFGLVAELEQRTDQTLSHSKHFAGTPLYAAPEQMGGNRTAASDWYALGVMLYEALSGERPFGGSLVELIKQKQNENAPFLVGRDDISRDFAELTDGLLARDPQKRPDALGVARTLTMEVESASQPSIDFELPATTSGSDQILIGRDKQLAELAGFQRLLLATRKPLAAFITGKSGEGKTSLAEKFLDPLRSGDDVLVLSGRCYDRESVPFKAIDSFIDSLVGYLRGCSDDDVQSLLPQDIRMLVHLFPVLARVRTIGELAKTPIGQLDSKQIRHRAFHALRELLWRISEQLPIVTFVDDLQWGDADSAEVLLQILASEQAPAILLLGSYRRDEADESPFLQQWEKQWFAADAGILKPNVMVGPLNQQQCLALMIARFGDSPMIQSRAAELFTSTGGNPYFLDQLIECFDPDTGSFNPVPLSEVIENKLLKLPRDAAELLNVIAVSGQATSLDEVSQAASVESTAYSTITHMRTERLVRLIGAEENQIVDTYHDKIRETVLDELGKSERRRLHLTLGKTIEASELVDGAKLFSQMSNGDGQLQVPPRVFDLAYHFEQAGHRINSLVYSILAAEQATGQFALPKAVEHYQAAESKLENTAKTIKYRVKYGFGSVLVLAAQYEEADKKLVEAVELANNPLQSISAKSQQADIIYKTGSVRASISACEALLAELGMPVPKTKLGKSFGVAKSAIRRRVYDWIGARLSPISRSQNEKLQLTIKVLLQFTYPCLFGDRASSLWATTVASELARKDGDKRLQALATAFQIFSASWFQCDFPKTNRYAKESLALASDLNDVYVQALSSFHQGAGYLCLGHYEEARAVYQNAIEKFNLIGDVWRKTITVANYAVCLVQIGDIVAAHRIANQGFQTAVQFGQHRLAMITLSSWANSTGDRIPLKQLMVTFEPVQDDLLSTSVLRNAESMWHLKNGRTPDGVQTALSAMDSASRLFAPMGLICAAFPTYARALREHADAIQARNPAESAKLRREAMKAAKRAVRITRKSTYDLPHALRELALNYLHFGKIKKARKFILESCAVADRQGARFEYAKSLLVCGQIREKLGLADAKKQIEEADSQLAEFEKQIEQATAESFGEVSAQSDR